MKRTITLLAAFVVIVAGIAAIGVGVTVKRPQRVVADAMAKLKQERSFYVSLTMSSILRARASALGLEGASELALPLQIYGYGGVDLSSQPNPRASILFSVADEKTSAALFGIEVRSTADGTTFVRFDAGLTAASPEIATLVGRWFYVDSGASTLLGADGATGGIGRIWGSLIDGSMLTYRARSASEIIDGSPAGHYMLGAKRGIIDDALVELFAIMRAAGEQAQSDGDIRQALARHDVSAEVWVDKKTGLLKRLGLAVVPTPDEVLPLPLVLAVNIIDRGKEVTVNTPTKVEPLSAALSSAFSAGAGSE
jgi:hypothetical protein